MRFTCTIDMDNAAFDNDDQLAYLLRKLAERVSFSLAGEPRPGHIGTESIHDENGNRVGSWKIAADLDA